MNLYIQSIFCINIKKKNFLLLYVAVCIHIIKHYGFQKGEKENTHQTQR